MRCVSGELLTIASFNTRGIPLTGSQLAERYAVIGAGFDAGDADVVLLPGGVDVLAPAAAGPPDALVPAGAEYLPATATPHCIDFILTAGEVTVESNALVFAEKEPLGYVSDHIGLRARLSLTPTG